MTISKDKKQRMYNLVVNEEQLKIISACVEDIHRFLCGEVELWNTKCLLDDVKNRRALEDGLRALKPFVTPQLERNESYSWNGMHCPCERQRKMIAKTYGIWREIKHFFAKRDADNGRSVLGNVYVFPTLTCLEGGDVVTISEINE